MIFITQLLNDLFFFFIDCVIMVLDKLHTTITHYYPSCQIFNTVKLHTNIKNILVYIDNLLKKIY